MKIDAKVGGRPRPGRDLRSWCGRIQVVATNEGDQFVLAAIYRALLGQASEELQTALQREACECQGEHILHNGMSQRDGN